MSTMNDDWETIMNESNDEKSDFDWNKFIDVAWKVTLGITVGVSLWSIARYIGWQNCNKCYDCVLSKYAPNEYKSINAMSARRMDEIINDPELIKYATAMFHVAK